MAKKVSSHPKENWLITHTSISRGFLNFPENCRLSWRLLAFCGNFKAHFKNWMEPFITTAYFNENYKLKELHKHSRFDGCSILDQLEASRSFLDDGTAWLYTFMPLLKLRLEASINHFVCYFISSSVDWLFGRSVNFLGHIRHRICTDPCRWNSLIIYIFMPLLKLSFHQSVSLLVVWLIYQLLGHIRRQNLYWPLVGE